MVTGVTITSAKTPWDDKAKIAKADYLILEAQNAYFNEDYDRYEQLVKRAHRLDTTNTDITAEWAMIMLTSETTDSATYERAYDALKKKAFEDGVSYYQARYFAQAASQIGRFDDAVQVWESIASRFTERQEPAAELAKVYLNKYINGDTSAFDKAIQIYDDIESRRGKSIETVNIKIKAYALNKDTAAITSELNALDSISPNDSYIALFTGAYYDYLDNKEKALEYYDRACQLDSTNGQAYAARADYYISIGDSAAYDREVFLALLSQNLDPDNKVQILRSYVVQFFNDSTQSKRIHQLFNTLEEMHPGEAQIHNLYGAYLAVNDESAEAAEQYSFASALAPDNEDYLASYIRASIQAGDTIQALKSLDLAIERFASNLGYPLMKCYIYKDLGDTSMIYSTLDSVKITDVKNKNAVANFLTSKADIYSALGDTLRALPIYDEAIALDPANNMALNNAAYFITLTGGDLDKAERYSLRSLKGDDLNPTYLDTYAWVLFHKKQYSMAKMYIDMALNAYPNTLTDPDEKTSDEGAEIPAQQDIDAASADIYDHAGDIYFMNGDAEGALKFWEKALKCDPQNALIQKKVQNKTIFLPPSMSPQ